MITRYVNTASSGGDGTTNAESGATAAYASLSAFEAAEGGVLSDAIEAICTTGSGAAADTTQAIFTGWTTTAANDITIKPDPTNDARGATYDLTKYRLEVANHCIIISDAAYMTIDSIQLSVGGSLGFRYGVNGNYSLVTGILSVINCYIREVGTGSTRRGISVNSNISNVEIKNNTVADFNGTSGSGIVSTSPGIAYNNTVTDCVTGILTGTNNLLAKNNLCFGCTTDYSGTFATGTDYNAYQVGSSGGANDLDISAEASGDLFTNYASGDFTLASGAAVIGQGIGPVSDSDVPATDPLGNTRSGTTTDMGAYLFVAPTPSTGAVIGGSGVGGGGVTNVSYAIGDSGIASN